MCSLITHVRLACSVMEVAVDMLPASIWRVDSVPLVRSLSSVSELIEFIVSQFLGPSCIGHVARLGETSFGGRPEGKNHLEGLSVRGVADKSLARHICRCLRTESIVSLERGICSFAELQAFSCYRG